MLAAWLLLAALELPAPLHEWRLTADSIDQQTLKPLAGHLSGTITGPVRFGTDRASGLIFDGNSAKKHGIILADDLADAKLPTTDITVEAWVRVDKSAEWGGLVGALQDNGAYEKGWLLGFNKSQFCFAVIGEKNKALTYLKANTHFQLGYWYHVVGTYDGVEQRIYVNGKLSATAKDQKGPIAYPPKTWVTLGIYKDDDEHHALNGQMQQAAIWNQALAPEKVLARFTARKSDFPDMDAKLPVVVDWPMYLRDPLRTGASTETLSTPLHLEWSHQTRFAPAPAWPEEAKNDYWHNKYDMAERVNFDRAFHLISANRRVYFGSSAEDAVFCLDAASGKTLWRYTTEGPVRLAPTYDNGKLFFGSDDGHAYCLDAADGKLLWKRLLAPSPRRIPGNGRMISAWPVRTDVLIDGEKAFVCAGVFPSQGVYQYTLNANDGEVIIKKTITITAQGYQARMFGKVMIATGRNPQGAFVADLEGAGRDVDRGINALPKDYPYAFISVGNLRFGGGDGKVAAFEADTGKKVWEAKVHGKAFSLAAVKDRLFVSTDQGQISCFTPRRINVSLVTPGPILPLKGGAPAVAEILQNLGSKQQGYGLMLSAANIEFSMELAQRSGLRWIVRDPDARAVARMREAIQALGLHDRIVAVEGGLDELPYSDHTFNLILAPKGNVTEVERVLRPHGGVALVGPDAKVIRRTGPLPGEGQWTHQYGDAGNIACSKDDRVTGDLMLQWFGKPGPRDMIDRHHRTAAPLYKNGRLFVPGEDRVTAVDAYNGAILWEKPFPDSRRVVIFRDSSYLALDDAHLYLASQGSVKLIDPETGKTHHDYPLPSQLGERDWGYLARPADVILGSSVKPGSARRTQSNVVDRTETYYDYVPLVCSDALFALDSKTGRPLWTHKAKGLIPNPAIAADDKAVYFLESRNAKTLEAKLGRAKMFDLTAVNGIDAVALDLKTGKELWRKNVEIDKLDHIVYATVAGGNLILSGSRNSTKDKKTGTVWYDVHVFESSTGKHRWSVTQDQRVPIGGDHGEQDQHPVIVGNKLYQEPFAYDLDTGSRLEWNWPWVGKMRRGCGNITASNNQFFFRNDTTSMFDLTEGATKKVTTETRPGCWVNVLPVGGLVLAPEASSGCSCNYSVQTSLALIPVARPAVAPPKK